MPARPRFLFILLAVWFAVLFWSSSQSRLHPPGPQFLYKDKVLHAAYFMIGGTLMFVGLRLKKNVPGLLATTLITFVFCSAVGAFDEWHQSFTHNRSGNDPYDWLADTVGGLFGAMAGHNLLRFFKTRASC